jgi:MFS family permease
LSHAGLTPPEVALLWFLFHVVKAGATYAGGRLSDRLGRRPMVIAGWAVYALIYIGFAAFQGKPGLVAIFLAYGIYFGLTEPVERAWIADLAPASRRATAFGYYHATVGAAARPASLLFGFLWEAFGSETAFGVGAALALSGVIVLTLGPRLTRAPIRDLHHGASGPGAT